VPIAVGRLLAVVEFVKASFAEAVTAAATFTIAAAVAGVGRLAATSIVVVAVTAAATFVIAASVADVGRLAATSIVVVAVTAAATFVIAAAVVDVGRLAATAIVAVLGGKATSAFPVKSIQKLFASLRTARRARPSTPARCGIGRVIWMARTRGRS
jgi:hypothetical protein